MPHIHTKPGEIDHTISAFIIRTDMDEPRVLLHMHRKLHKLLPIGGHIELNEAPWNALGHELFEESGYRLETLSVLQPKELQAIDYDQYEGVLVQPVPIFVNAHRIVDEHYHTDATYALIANAPPDQPPHEGESQDLRWLSRDEVAALTRDDAFSNTRTTMLSIFDVFLAEWSAVPAKSYLGDIPK